jgi:signal transduction histidine kinase
MLRSLKVRLALSHSIPVLLLVPLLALVLLHQLERRFFIDNLAVELEVQGALIAKFIEHDQSLWRDPESTVAMLENLQIHIPGQIMLLDGQGHLLSAEPPAGWLQVGEVVDAPVVSAALQEGTLQLEIDQGSGLREEFIDIAVPILNGQGEIVGIVRLAHSLASIQERLSPLRSVILATILGGGAIALLIGLALAGSISGPLARLTQLVSQLDLGKSPEPLPEEGPEEVEMLATTINHLWDRLQRLELDRRRLLAGIVHEINRPLGAVKVAAQTIVTSADRESAALLATGIDDQVNRLQRQLDDLALLALIDLHKMVLHRERVEFTDIVRAQCQQFSELARQKNIQLACDLPQEPLLVYADARRLHQVVGNLLHNAYKFTVDGGSVFVSVNVDSNNHDEVVLRIRDSGPGIDPSEQTKIFDFFYRSPRQRIQKGIGLGLAISRQVADSHGGSLTVESELGQGATFVLRLPIGETDIHPPATP